MLRVFFDFNAVFLRCDAFDFYPRTQVLANEHGEEKASSGNVLKRAD